MTATGGGAHTDHGASTTKPLSPSKCPLLCCFYVEFDNTVGPKICFQVPNKFMNYRPTSITEKVIEKLLSQEFARIKGHDSEASADAQDDAQDGGDDVSNSLFDAVSDYCITGHELADHIICVSTHNLHILTMPTVLYNERYDRNSLLFSVGFVIRGKEDARPFRPLLFKIVSTMKTLEVESQFLSKTASRNQLPAILSELLTSLNSKRAEANLVLDEANPLNLKLFKAPKPLTLPVPDYIVPVLLRPEWQIQMFDWDLTINWIVPHIDGVKTTKAIAQASEVDLEMVRACLRVLKHHEVLTFIDIFQYSNRYESTPLASAMLQGFHPKLLDYAYNFAARSPVIRRVPTIHSGSTLEFANDESSVAGNSKTPDSNSTRNTPIIDQQVVASLNGQHASSPSSSDRSIRCSPSLVAMPSSSSPTIGYPTGLHSRPTRQQSSNSAVPSLKRNRINNTTEGMRGIKGSFESLVSINKRENRTMKRALAQMYCFCKRKSSFGELISSLTKSSLSAQDESTIRRETTSDDRSDEIAHTGLDSIYQSSRFANKFRASSSLTSICESSSQIPSDPHDIDWKEVINFFDVRRLITFGIIHGLLHRIHDFPLVLSEDQDRQYKYDQAQIKQIVSSMDGTTCDDELCCTFQKSYREILYIAHEESGRDVMHIYSNSTCA